MPPAPEPVTVVEVPAAITNTTSDLGSLFSEAPVPRSRRRSSLLPQPPTPASAVAGRAEPEIEATPATYDSDDEHELSGAPPLDQSSELDDDIDAETARSIPPPLVSPRAQRRASIAVGVVLAGVVVWAGARKLRSRGAAAPASSVPMLALSAEIPAAPAASADDQDLDPGDNSEDLPFDEAKGLALRKEARAMLEAGRIDDGVATARRAIEANPNDAENYILLAAGLQDQGKWNEAKQIFGKCVRQSTRAEKSECLYFATRGR
jgi:tetratricopeptide (TPR) repeat protein